MRVTRSLVARCLFAFVLVFGQHQALTHALDHDFDRIHRHADASGAHESACAQCLALAGLGHANAGAPVLVFATHDAPAPFAVIVADAPHRTAPTPYRTRAPPFFA